MATVTRPSSALGYIAGGVAAVVIGLPVGIILLLGGGSGCGGPRGGAGPAPSSAAKGAIPGNYLTLYRQAGKQYGVPWNLLAAIGSVETDHGRSTLPGVRSGTNSAGAAGPMQFIASTFARYKVDGNHDGKTDVYDPEDAIPSAAAYLKASGAPGDLEQAIFAYNHSAAYVADVMAKMRTYGGQNAASLSAPDNLAGIGGDCADGGGLAVGSGDGTYKVAAGANRPGVPITALLDAFVTKMATFYSGTLILTTGTNHSQYTTTHNVSDHYSGNGADFGMVANGGTNDGPVGDRIAAAAFLAAGLPRSEAITRGRAGGAQTIVANGVRIQVIWKSDVGGNHHDHVHVGLAG